MYLALKASCSYHSFDLINIKYSLLDLIILIHIYAHRAFRYPKLLLYVGDDRVTQSFEFQTCNLQKSKNYIELKSCSKKDECSVTFDI